MTQPGVASLLRGGVKLGVAGRSHPGAPGGGHLLPLLGVQGDPPLSWAAPRCQLWEESWRERATLAGTSVRGTGGVHRVGREGSPSTVGAVFLFPLLEQNKH